MIKKLLFASALAASAAVTTTDAVAQAGPCPHLRTEWACVNYYTGECFWDYTDYRCESRWGGTDNVCGYYHNEYYCSRDYRCFWDSTDYRCERRYTP